MRVLLRSLFLLTAVVSVWAVTPASAGAVLVLFKDGFVIHGRITVPKEWIVDKVSHQAFSVPVGGAPYSIEDGVRKIVFSPDQVHDVLKDKTPDLMSITFVAPKTLGERMPPVFEVEEAGPWDEHWQRSVKVNTLPSPLTQRVTLLAPHIIRVDALKYDWIPFYRPQEWDPGTVRSLLFHYYTKKKERPVERHLHIARFMLQAGWTEQAKRELDELSANFPDYKEKAQDLVDSLKKTQSADFLEALEAAQRNGRPLELRERLERFGKDKEIGASLDQKELLRVQELQTNLDAAEEQLKEARGLLKGAPAHVALARRADYTQAVETILKELTADTLPRLETFVGLARDQELAVKQGRRPNQSPETVLAFALSGWVLGNAAAEENVPAAWQLWQARQLLLDYQKTQQGVARAKFAASLQSANLAPDVVARIIRLLPPPDPYEKLTTGVLELQSEAPEQARPVSYLVQLPPEYNHQRAYPVLMVLHRSDEKPAAMLARWADLAAKNGYILAAPSWGGGGYGYTDREQAAALDCLRDLRRRFQVDSDRVFLFGAEEGGSMAYDLGLGHPDQFAGVLVMSAYPNYFAWSYRYNAQFLPFYVVDGERHAKSPVANRKQFADWVRWGYPVLYVEYRGRTGELFEAELPQMMDWMNRKKRYHPTREVGRKGEEFLTMRPSDNRFYWLSTTALGPSHVNDPRSWNNNMKPATLGVSILKGNDIYLRASGVQQVTLWLEPGVVTFGEKLKMQFNGSLMTGVPNVIRPNLETLLEDFYYQGDRQRLFLARIDLNIKGG